MGEERGRKEHLMPSFMGRKRWRTLCNNGSGGSTSPDGIFLWGYEDRTAAFEMELKLFLLAGSPPAQQGCKPSEEKTENSPKLAMHAYSLGLCWLFSCQAGPAEKHNLQGGRAKTLDKLLCEQEQPLRRNSVQGYTDNFCSSLGETVCRNCHELWSWEEVSASNLGDLSKMCYLEGPRELSEKENAKPERVK